MWRIMSPLYCASRASSADSRHAAAPSAPARLRRKMRLLLQRGPRPAPPGLAGPDLHPSLPDRRPSRGDGEQPAGGAPNRLGAHPLRKAVEGSRLRRRQLRHAPPLRPTPLPSPLLASRPAPARRLPLRLGEPAPAPAHLHLRRPAPQKAAGARRGDARRDPPKAPRHPHALRPDRAFRNALLNRETASRRMESRYHTSRTPNAASASSFPLTGMPSTRP